jgi:hypothetical protein
VYVGRAELGVDVGTTTLEGAEEEAEAAAIVVAIGVDDAASSTLLAIRVVGAPDTLSGTTAVVVALVDSIAPGVTVVTRPSLSVTTPVKRFPVPPSSWAWPSRLVSARLSWIPQSGNHSPVTGLKQSSEPSLTAKHISIALHSRALLALSPSRFSIQFEAQLTVLPFWMSSGVHLRSPPPPPFGWLKSYHDFATSEVHEVAAARPAREPTRNASMDFISTEFENESCRSTAHSCEDG